MDTPKLGIPFLERFPPDIWAHFAWYLPGEQLGRLMMTGATVLWRILRYPKVVKSIKLGEDFIVFKSWPRFLNNFSTLDELLIYSCHDNWSSKLCLEFDSIPPGVRKLELRGSWNKTITKVFGGPDVTLNLHKHLPHLETLALCDLEIPYPSWMTHSPQSLTKLSLHSWNGTVELPSSLIQFEAYTIDLSTTSFVSKLPPSLDSFEVTQLYGIELIVPLFPASMRKLSLGEQARYSSRGPRTAQKLLEQIPKSLTCLIVPRFVNIKFGANPELTTLFPVTLRELNIHPSFPGSAWHLLPQQLTKLSITAPKHVGAEVIGTDAEEHHEAPRFPFDALPRSITSLCLLLKSYSERFFCGPPNASTCSYFPPQLTSLEIPNIQLSPETARLLPPSLTFLMIDNICERVCEHLPKSLRTLIACRTLMSPNLIKFLPESLTSFNTSIPSSDDSWFDCNTGKIIEPLSDLQEYSIHKTCLLQSFDWKDCSPLPPWLTTLALDNAQGIGDSFLWHQKLPNLRELSLNGSEHFSDLIIPRLSPHLTTLNFRCSSMVSGKSFQFLPGSLTDLCLSNSESIFDSDIQHLPRALKILGLRHAIHLTGNCIPDLPPHLESLDMEKNSQISPSSFPNLPYPLRSSQAYRPAEFAKWYISDGLVLHH